MRMLQGNVQNFGHLEQNRKMAPFNVVRLGWPVVRKATRETLLCKNILGHILAAATHGTPILNIIYFHRSQNLEVNRVNIFVVLQPPLVRRVLLGYLCRLCCSLHCQNDLKP